MLSGHVCADAFATRRGSSVRSQWKGFRSAEGMKKGTVGVCNEEIPRITLGKMMSLNADASDIDIDTSRGKKTGYSNGAGSNLDGTWEARLTDDLRL
jgi:hypothetical protein